jgi:stage V sporulation protein R
VIYQPEFDDPRYCGLNPYALGFAMMQDIERLCMHATDEDREWLPGIAGQGDAMAVLQDIWANYRDESFIAQFLSPRLIRQWRMFHLSDDPDDPELHIAAIHNERGYVRVRRMLARQHDISWSDPDIQVMDVDLNGDRRLVIHHNVLNHTLLEQEDAKHVLQHIADLWGYDVVLKEVDVVTGIVLREHSARTRPLFF